MDGDRDGLTKLKKAVKALHASGNGENTNEKKKQKTKKKQVKTKSKKGHSE